MVDGWWREVLTMYAEMARDISSLVAKTYEIRRGEGLSDEPELLSVLRDLLARAPNTDAAAKYRVEKDWEIHTSVEKSFENLEDFEILRGKGKPKSRSR
jgi:hypothetical protein